MASDTLNSPFCIETSLPFVARVEGRSGYVQFATSQLATTFEALSPSVFQVAHAWACQLERWPNVERVYWFVLSEQVRHLHIHLFPRFTEDTLRGTALFEARFQTSQAPDWSEEQRQCLHTFCQQQGVALLVPDTWDISASLSE